MSPTRRLPPAWAAAFVPTASLLRSASTGTLAIVAAAVAVLVVLAAGRRSVLAAVPAAVGAAGALLLLTDAPVRVVGCFLVVAGLSGFAAGVVALPRNPRPARPSIALAVPLVVADIGIVVSDRRVVPIVFLAVAGALVLWAMLVPSSWTRFDRRMQPYTAEASRVLGVVERTLAWVFRHVGGAVGRAVVIGSFVPAVVVPWIIGRIVRWDPLSPPSRRHSRWVPRDHSPELDSLHLWFSDPAPRRIRFRHATRQLAPLLVVAVLVGSTFLVVRAVRSRDVDPSEQLSATPPPPPPPSKAMLGALAQPWFQDVSTSILALDAQSHISQYAGVEYGDFTSKHVNVRDGIRRSWTPPASSCRRAVRVWIFGGSTLFGLSQRDTHTVASELARVAWAAGVPLRVENYGIPGDSAWQEYLRLQQAVATTTSLPDLVVFYDGFNDVVAPAWTYATGQDVTGRFRTLSDQSLMPLLGLLQKEMGEGGTKYTVTPPPAAVRPTDWKVVTDATVFQYSTTHQYVDEFLRQRGVPFVQFFQPTRYSRANTVEGDWQPNQRPESIRQMAEVRRRLPAGVVDIAGVLDASDEPFYLDEVHTTEAANDLIAAAMWEHIGPMVVDLGVDPGAPAC